MSLQFNKTKQTEVKKIIAYVVGFPTITSYWNTDPFHEHLVTWEKGLFQGNIIERTLCMKQFKKQEMLLSLHTCLLRLFSLYENVTWQQIRRCFMVRRLLGDFYSYSVNQEGLRPVRFDRLLKSVTFYQPLKHRIRQESEQQILHYDIISFTFSLQRLVVTGVIMILFRQWNTNSVREGNVIVDVGAT